LPSVIGALSSLGGQFEKQLAAGACFALPLAGDARLGKAAGGERQDNRRGR
jgi:hypothetical protein